MPITTSHWSWPALTRAWSVCGSGRLSTVDRARLVDLLLGAVADEDRLDAPEHLDDLPVRDRAEIDLDRRAGRDRRGVRVHLRDQRHQRRRAPTAADGTGRDIEKIAARRLGRRHRCHVCVPLPRSSPCRAATRDAGPTRRQSCGGGRTGRFHPGEGRSGAIQRRSIGTLAGERKPANAPNAQAFARNPPVIAGRSRR